MKTHMRVTSLITFQEVLCSLGDRQKLVLNAIKRLQPCNNLMIQKYLNIPINSVTPRTKELRKRHLVIIYKQSQCPYTQRLTDFYIIPSWINGLLK